MSKAVDKRQHAPCRIGKNLVETKCTTGNFRDAHAGELLHRLHHTNPADWRPQTLQDQ